MIVKSQIGFNFSRKTKKWKNMMLIFPMKIVKDEKLLYINIFLFHLLFQLKNKYFLNIKNYL